MIVALSERHTNVEDAKAVEAMAAGREQCSDLCERNRCIRDCPGRELKTITVALKKTGRSLKGTSYRRH